MVVVLVLLELRLDTLKEMGGRLMKRFTELKTPKPSSSRPTQGPGSLWRVVHDKFLIAYRHIGNQELARILDRSEGAISSRLKRIGIKEC